MILLGNTQSLSLQTLGAGKVDYTVHYADHTTETFALGSSQGTVSAVADTTITSVGTNIQRQIKSIMVVNRDTSPTAQTVLIKKSTIVLTADTPLGTGETLEYLGDRGWKVLDRQGKVKTQSAMSGPGSRLALGPCAAGMGTQSRVHANTQFWIVYVGKSPRYPVTSMQVRWRTTVAAVGTVWAELAILTGTTPHAANGAGTMSTVQARVLGHANVSPQVDSIGIHNTTINTLTGIVIPPDEDVWIGFNSEFNTSGCTLSSSMSDDVISGAIALSTTVFRRPSVDLGQTLAIPGLLVLTVFPTFQVYWT